MDGEGKRGERERGHSQISVPPAARVPLRCGGKCPRAAKSGQDPRPRPRDPVRPPAPGPGRGGPQRPRRRVPLTCWPVAGGCAGPPYAPPAPELGPGSPKSRNMP